MGNEMPEKLRVLDLFSGIGGFSLGLERTGGFETVAFCEIDPYCRAVLKKHWPDVPIFEDVRSLRGDEVGPIDLICGGYPCQPFSYAGKRQGKEDDRHLWPEVHRLVASIRPTWCLFENVAGHITMGLDEVLLNLEGEGYACQPLVVPACAVDAPHRRDRVWIIAHTHNKGREGPHDNGKVSTWFQLQPSVTSRIGKEGDDPDFVFQDAHSDRREQGTHREPIETNTERPPEPQQKRKDCRAPSTDTNGAGSQGGLYNIGADTERREKPGLGRPSERGYRWDWGGVCRWEVEPNVGRVAHGVPRRVDRLRCLGNAVVPQIPEIIGRAILEAEGFSMSNTPQKEQHFEGSGE
jgi:DNA (cytosine-5)-methyltransferase 1